MRGPENREVPRWFRELLKTELSPWITLSAQQIEQLYGHYELLVDWNKRINLTSVQPGPEMIIRHYCESLFFAAHLPSDEAVIADVGSGAGFPGVPMAILNAGWKLALIESNQRKAVFLRESTREMPNISVLAHRAADVVGHFDWLVSRAVNLNDVLMNVPRLAPRVGLMISEADFSEAKSLSRIAWDEPIRLPWGDRRICIYGKVSCST